MEGLTENRRNAEALQLCAQCGYRPDAHAPGILGQRPRLYGFRGLNIMGDRNCINYPCDSSNGMESRFKP